VVLAGYTMLFGGWLQDQPKPEDNGEEPFNWH
jgi:hypothetical protein